VQALVQVQAQAQAASSPEVPSMGESSPEVSVVSLPVIASAASAAPAG
jgi:hypothetical protein